MLKLKRLVTLPQECLSRNPHRSQIKVKVSNHDFVRFERLNKSLLDVRFHPALRRPPYDLEINFSIRGIRHIRG